MHPWAAGPSLRDRPLPEAPAWAGGLSGSKKKRKDAHAHGREFLGNPGPEVHASDVYAVGVSSDGLALAIIMLTSVCIAHLPRGYPCTHTKKTKKGEGEGQTAGQPCWQWYKIAHAGGDVFGQREGRSHH